jgi:hypothetical protein
METVAAVFAVVMGCGIATVWTADLLRGTVDLSGGVVGAREEEGGSLLLPHWLAEYATAAALVVGGVGLLVDTAWAQVVAAAAFGACAYTSVNSLGWALARPERRPYAIPMAIGAVGSVLAIVVLLSATGSR